ncbi:SusC/RagA family TonB-linked outer membrane protein [Dyadobacter subterraneus]|uniref:SusC/RagA family TonB-linked outer membrane protein n=1 Tax=Dyadobacter subterraneus TaxID=2773304 RepID=A0ABR9WHA0_9BACT|nr:SusC/RagA family TonB-linked outer membrane protein [Dyadobacter subterraneus]MBE9464880.1 SusC/RagA family TonB-linked outer membrane protein [Dyadobacter subterraneus]
MRKFLLSLLGITLLLSNQLYAQQVNVTGKVTADDGSTLPGVNIAVKSSTNGTTTDVQGNYSLQVNQGATLIFSFIGFASKEIVVGNQSVINVTLAAGPNQLSEVVVTALGSVREKRSLGYAVSDLNGDQLAKSGEANIVQSLAGKTAGVIVTGSSGLPGASSKIVLRGPATFTGEQQPLIVVDGVPINNETVTSSAGDYPFNANLSGVNNSNRALDINPDDIESVTILKGPAASALYGARAGNGAILYTTKRGKKQKGIGVTVNYRLELSEVNKLPDLQREYAQGTSGNYITADPGPDLRHGTDDDISAGTASSWGPKISSDPSLKSYDNPGNFFKTAVSHNTNVTLSGGNDKSSFRLSLGNLTQNGIIPNTDYKRNSVRLTADSYLTDNFKVGGTVNYINSGGIKSQNGSNVAGTMLSLLRTPASFDLRQYKYDNGYNRTYFSAYDNPLYSAYENPFRDEINRVLGNIYLNYHLNKYFDVTYKLGVDSYSDRRQQIYAISSNGDDNSVGYGQVNFDNVNSRDIYGDLIFRGEVKPSDKFGINYTVGHNVTSANFYDNFQRGRNLTVQNFYNLGNASELYASNDTQRKFTTAVFGQLDFDYASQIYVSLTGRNEWSSTFGKSKNNFFYPSANVSWVFSELFSSDIVSFGKLRYAYSEAGISPSAYRNQTYFGKPSFTDGFTNGLSFPYNGVNGYSYYNQIVGNTNLKPERVIGNEIGLNLKFLKQRFDLDLTVYNQKTEDILLNRPTAPASGFTAEYTNSGQLRNRGVEVMISANAIKTPNFSWDISLNWSKNVSKVLKLAEGVQELSLESAFTGIGGYAIVGEPLGVLYGSKWQRNDKGDLIIGSNGIPLQETAQGNIGNPYPKWLSNLRNSFTYKGITLTALIDVRHGGSIWNGTYARLNRIGVTKESADRERTYVIPGVTASGEPNTKEITALSYFSSYVGDGGAAAEQFVENVNWFRLREVGLSYRFKFKKYANYVDVSFTSRNLYLNTNYKGVDPETSLTGAGSNLQGFDYFNNPGSKSYIFGVNIGF